MNDPSLAAHRADLLAHRGAEGGEHEEEEEEAE
jgi:hypothetical protein